VLGQAACAALCSSVLRHCHLKQKRTGGSGQKSGYGDQARAEGGRSAAGPRFKHPPRRRDVMQRERALSGRFPRCHPGGTSRVRRFPKPLHAFGSGYHSNQKTYAKPRISRRCRAQSPRSPGARGEPLSLAVQRDWL
jgi:hypothetical protein